MVSLFMYIIYAFYKPKPILLVVEKLYVIFGLFSVVTLTVLILCLYIGDPLTNYDKLFYFILYLFIFSLLACDLRNKHCVLSRYEWRLA